VDGGSGEKRLADSGSEPENPMPYAGYEAKRILMSVFFVAVVLNYLWELAQAPLYVGLKSYNPAVFWHCFVASLGDGLMVLVILAVGWVMLHQPDWFEQPGILGYVVMLTAGLVMAVLVEWVGAHVLKRWEYTDKMPLVPGIGIGVVPIAQMLFLPPLIFRIVTVFGSVKT
jgi:hypothetical protein